MKYINIEAERARKNMTIEELAKEIGIARRTYYHYQTRGKIPASKLIAMAELFDCTIDYLLGRTA